MLIPQFFSQSQTLGLARCWVTWALSWSVRPASAARSSWASADSGSRPAPTAKTTKCAVQEGEGPGSWRLAWSHDLSASEASLAGGGT